MKLNPGKCADCPALIEQQPLGRSRFRCEPCGIARQREQSRASRLKKQRTGLRGPAPKPYEDTWRGKFEITRAIQLRKKQLNGCGFCGLALSGLRTKWCSSECREKSKGRSPRKASAALPRCQHCMEEFKPYNLGPKQRARGHVQVYCSSLCLATAETAMRDIADDLRPRFVTRMKPASLTKFRCQCCAVEFIADHKRKYCSSDCRVPTLTTRACKRCSKPFTVVVKDHRYGFCCSEECKRSRKRSVRLKHRVVRRLRLKHTTIEHVDPLKVFSRDKWKCQLCGVRTPQIKRGTYECDAPELDHITPLALGGEHSYRNTQCACRGCNSAKGARELGQMRLF